MKNTLVVNLFGGPGCGKSTLMAGIFHQLKLKGYDCEMVTEFMKDLVWEKELKLLKTNCIFSQNKIIDYLELMEKLI